MGSILLFMTPTYLRHNWEWGVSVTRYFPRTLSRNKLILSVLTDNTRRPIINTVMIGVCRSVCAGSGLRVESCIATLHSLLLVCSKPYISVCFCPHITPVCLRGTPRHCASLIQMIHFCCMETLAVFSLGN